MGNEKSNYARKFSKSGSKKNFVPVLDMKKVSLKQIHNYMKCKDH